MPRRVKKSHVFATKSRPKRSNTALKQKRHLPSNTPPTLEPSFDTEEPKESSESGRSSTACSEVSSRDGLFPDSSTMATTPSMSVELPKVSAVSSSQCIVSKNAFCSTACPSSSGCASDVPAVPEHESHPHEPEAATSESENVTEHAAENSDKRKLSKPPIHRLGDNKHTTLEPMNPSSMRRTRSTFKSLGPSIIFNSLFGGRDDLVSTPIPSSRQPPAAKPAKSEVEQVPAYATTTHAAWFSSPANKIVRGVPMGISRSVAELQRIVRPTTPVLDLETSVSALSAHQ